MNSMKSSSISEASPSMDEIDDLKAEIDDLKAEIGELKAEIKKYKAEMEAASTPEEKQGLTGLITALLTDITALRNKENLLIQQNSTTGKYGNLYIYSVSYGVYLVSKHSLALIHMSATSASCCFHLLISSFIIHLIAFFLFFKFTL